MQGHKKHVNITIANDMLNLSKKILATNDESGNCCILILNVFNLSIMFMFILRKLFAMAFCNDKKPSK